MMIANRKLEKKMLVKMCGECYLVSSKDSVVFGENCQGLLLCRRNDISRSLICYVHFRNIRLFLLTEITFSSQFSPKIHFIAFL